MGLFLHGTKVAPEPGVIEAIMVAEGETITSEAVLATLTAGAVSTPTPSAKTSGSGEDAPDAASGTAESIPMGPAVRALLDEHGLFAGGYRRDGEGRPAIERGRAVTPEADT